MVAWFKCGAGKNSEKLAEHKGSEIAVTAPNGDSENKDQKVEEEVVQSEYLKMGEELKKEASNTLDGYSEEDAKEGNPAKIIVDGEERMFPPPPPDFFEKYTFLPEDNEGNSKPMPNEIEDPQMAKDLGVECFKEGNLDLAIAYWRQGLKKCLSALCSGGPDAMHNKSLSDIDLKCNLNIAMAEIKRENYQFAVDHCDKALRRRDMLDPEDLVKVLYRKAVAFDKMGKLEECLEELEDVLKISESNAAAKQLQQEVARKFNKQKAAQAKAMKSLFSKMDEQNQAEEQAQRDKLKQLSDDCVGQFTPPDFKTIADFNIDEHNTAQVGWYTSFPCTVVHALNHYITSTGAAYTWEKPWEMTIYFLGASSTCELRYLAPQVWLTRYPKVKKFRFVLIGFLGQLDDCRNMEHDSEEFTNGLQNSTTFFGNAREKRCSPAQDHERYSKETNTPEGEVNFQSVYTYQYRGFAQEFLDSEKLPEEIRKPSVVFIAQPHFHRYFHDWCPVIQKLIKMNVLSIVLGGSEPDYSKVQDKAVLWACGARNEGVSILDGPIMDPFPMYAGGNAAVRKNNHYFIFKGGDTSVSKFTPTEVMLHITANEENQGFTMVPDRLHDQNFMRSDGKFHKNAPKEAKDAAKITEVKDN